MSQKENSAGKAIFSSRAPSPLRARPHGCRSRCRWIKFEEKVEEGGERWSKPHVSTLSLHSLFELRTCLQTGTVLLDLDGYSLPQIIGTSGYRWLQVDFSLCAGK